MSWTNEAPTKNGYYFWRENSLKGHNILHLVENKIEKEMYVLKEEFGQEIYEDDNVKNISQWLKEFPESEWCYIGHPDSDKMFYESLDEDDGSEEKTSEEAHTEEIIQIIPADGWYAVHKHKTVKNRVFFEPIACWALTKVYSSENSNKSSTTIKGMFSANAEAELSNLNAISSNYPEFTFEGYEFLGDRDFVEEKDEEVD